MLTTVTTRRPDNGYCIIYNTFPLVSVVDELYCWKCNFPMNPHARLLVGRFVARLRGCLSIVRPALIS